MNRSKYQKIWKQTPKTKDSLLHYAKKYTNWMLEQNYSKRSFETRRSYLGLFLTWCYERNILSIYEITPDVPEYFQHYLLTHQSLGYKKVLSANARRSYLTSVSLFFRFLVKKRYLLHNPSYKLVFPRSVKSLPRNVLSQEEIEKVINNQNLEDKLGLRNRAILETLYSTGIRASELLHLTLNDINFEKGTLLVRRGKGNKDRVVPIGERAMKWIKKYVREQRSLLLNTESETKLFITRRGKPFKTVSTISHTVKIMMENAGIKKLGACHMVRHTTATLMLENGASTRHIQELLGHRYLETTQHYTKVSIHKLKEVYALTHPGELVWQNRARNKQGKE